MISKAFPGHAGRLAFPGQAKHRPRSLWPIAPLALALSHRGGRTRD